MDPKGLETRKQNSLEFPLELWNGEFNRDYQLLDGNVMFQFLLIFELKGSRVSIFPLLPVTVFDIALFMVLCFCLVRPFH